jgi:predicted ribosomally synthesized peptide with SipW-like signal peptide
MNKKIISLLFLLILLVSVTVSYAYFSQPTTIDNHQTDSGGDINQNTLTTEIDSTFLNETQEIEIGEMI